AWLMEPRSWDGCSIPRFSRCLCRRAMRSRCPKLVTDSNPTASADDTQAVDYGAAERRKRHGLTIVYTATGKGKRARSIGMGGRADGHGIGGFFLDCYRV